MLRPAAAATSSSVAGRPARDSSACSARRILPRRSTIGTGSRMGRDVFDGARPIAARIHIAAYVDNFTPRRQWYFSTARISPMLPSWIRSSRSRLPWPR